MIQLTIKVYLCTPDSKTLLFLVEAAAVRSPTCSWAPIQLTGPGRRQSQKLRMGLFSFQRISRTSLSCF